MSDEPINQPHSKHAHVFAIIRVDKYSLPSNPQDFNSDFITVTKVVRTQEEAEREVERLNGLNAAKDCTYLWQLTRLVEAAK